MKFSTSVLAFVAIASTYARSIDSPFLFNQLIKGDERSSFAELIKRKVSYNDEYEYKEVSEECEKELNSKKILKCASGVDIYNYEEACAAIKTDECQKIFKNIMDYAPSCKGQKLAEDILNPDFMGLYVDLQVKLCAYDEHGDLCPISTAILSHSKLGLGEIDETCRSKACTEQSIDLFRYMGSTGFDEIEKSKLTSGSYSSVEKYSIEKAIEFFNSDQCKSASGSNDKTTGNVVSSATGNPGSTGSTLSSSQTGGTANEEPFSNTTVLTVSNGVPSSNTTDPTTPPLNNTVSSTNSTQTTTSSATSPSITMGTILVSLGLMLLSLY